MSNKPQPKFIYGIKVPYISKGLKRTYNKQLEVHKYLLNTNSDSNHMYNQVSTVKFKHLSNFTESKTGCDVIYKRSLKINNTVVSDNSNSYDVSNMIYFDSLNSAYISKLLLIKNMKNQYEAELEDLRNTMNKNIPKLDAHLEEATEEYPELFV